jgi:hypothetical protein
MMQSITLAVPAAEFAHPERLSVWVCGTRAALVGFLLFAFFDDRWSVAAFAYHRVYSFGGRASSMAFPLITLDRGVAGDGLIRHQSELAIARAAVVCGKRLVDEEQRGEEEVS